MVFKMAKVVLIGSNHSGIAAANTLLGNYPGNELVIIDRNTNLSYALIYSGDGSVKDSKKAGAPARGPCLLS